MNSLVDYSDSDASSSGEGSEREHSGGTPAPPAPKQAKPGPTSLHDSDKEMQEPAQRSAARPSPGFGLPDAAELFGDASSASTSKPSLKREAFKVRRPQISVRLVCPSHCNTYGKLFKT
eukprot:scaffold182742_cov28-Prasinocladus_malaysianus.AAC.1